MTRQRLTSRHLDCVVWLRDQPERWVGLPSDTEDVEAIQSLKLAELVVVLRTHGVLSKGGALDAQKFAVRRAIGQLKREAAA